MIAINRNKFYNAIFSFLSETMMPDVAENQANAMTENIIGTICEIDNILKSPPVNSTVLSKKFHTLKNFLLYGDFYYESDLCQDIEMALKNNNFSTVETLYVELLDGLQM